ncbi:MAG: glycosyl hydrolase family 18 protein [Deltaproteobacteria bacterium]
MERKIIAVISFVAALLVFSLALIGYFLSPTYKTISINPAKNTILEIEGNVIELKEPPIYENNQLLLPISTVKKYLDKNIFWDEKAKKVIITTQDKVIKLIAGKVSAFVNEKPVTINTSVKIVSGTVYMPVDFLKDVYRIDIKYVKKYNIVIIDYRDSIKRTAEIILKKAVVRNEMSIKAPVIKWLKEKDSLRVFDEYEKWYKVRIDEGLIGYIQKKDVKITALTSSIYTEYKQEPAVPPASRIAKGKINLVWDYIEGQTPDMSSIQKIKGLDVISPTWFRLKDKEIIINSLADFKYLEWAKLNGYSVWPLLSNDSNSALASKILNDSSLREKVIQELLVYVKLYKLEGINLDFENLKLEDKDVYTQFVRELAPPLRQMGVILSVDVGVPGGSDNWSKCYDRKALAEVVDYVMVMTYDQHWGTSPVSGSVAQYDWVEDKIKLTLQEVPESKLLIGLPFYTREWKEDYAADGKMIGKPSSVAISMQEAQQSIIDNKAKLEWDESSGQYYAEYSKGNSKYKIWIEDQKSINLKSSLVHKYQLAGAASWRRGYETPDIWAVLNKNLKGNVNYTEWAKANDNTRNR